MVNNQVHTYTQLLYKHEHKQLLSVREKDELIFELSKRNKEVEQQLAIAKKKLKKYEAPGSFVRFVSRVDKVLANDELE